MENFVASAKQHPLDFVTWCSGASVVVLGSISLLVAVFAGANPNALSGQIPNDVDKFLVNTAFSLFSMMIMISPYVFVSRPMPTRNLSFCQTKNMMLCAQFVGGTMLSLAAVLYGLAISYAVEIGTLCSSYSGNKSEFDDFCSHASPLVATSAVFTSICLLLSFSVLLSGCCRVRFRQHQQKSSEPLNKEAVGDGLDGLLDEGEYDDEHQDEELDHSDDDKRF